MDMLLGLDMLKRHQVLISIDIIFLFCLFHNHFSISVFD